MNIRLAGIVKRFGSIEAVSAISLEIKDGELFTLLGPSGCGKTTLLRLIGGFHLPDRGEIFFGTRRIVDSPPYERNIGMVFQNYALWPHMTIFENVAYGLKIRNLQKAEIPGKVDRALGLVNLKGYEGRYPGQLSGGQQQRVALARALVLNPDVLLLDEPLSNLDAKVRLQVRAEIRKLQKELGITTVYVTHDQEEALTLSDRIAVISQGRVQQIGTPFELYERPVNAFVADFIGINNLIPGTVEKTEVERKRVFVSTAYGPVVSFSEGGLKSAEKCVLCVRPETASIHPSEMKEPDCNILSGIVGFASYIGNTIRYDVELSKEFIFKVDVQNPWDHKPIPIGQRIFVRFPVQTSLAIPAGRS